MLAGRQLHQRPDDRSGWRLELDQILVRFRADGGVDTAETLMSASPLSTQSTAGADWPPSWRTMPHGISVGRYIDPGFLRLEFEKLWSKVWQVAARLDEIPGTGDFTVYNIGDQSVLVVRVDDSNVKAYHNVCPHRGTALGE